MAVRTTPPHTHTHIGIQGPGAIAPDLTRRIEKMACNADLIALKRASKVGVITSDKAKGRLLELRNARKFRNSTDAIRSPRLRSMDNDGKLPSFTDILSATDEEKKAERGRKKGMKLRSGFTSPRGQVHSPRRGGEGGSTEEGKGTDLDGDSSELTAVDEMDDDDDDADIVYLREALTTPRDEKEKGHRLSIWLDGAVSDEAVVAKEVAPRESKSTPAFVSTKSTLVSYYATRHLGEEVAEEVVPRGVAARTRTRSQAQDDTGGGDECSEWTEADTFDARHRPSGSFAACLANKLSPVHEDKAKEYDAYDNSDGGSVTPGDESRFHGGSVITDNLHDGSSYDGDSSELSADVSIDTVVDNVGNRSTYEQFKKKAEDVRRGIVSGDGVGAAHMAAMFTTPTAAVISPEGSYLSETSESLGRYSPHTQIASYWRTGQVEGVAVTPHGSTVHEASIVHGYNLDR